MTLLFSINPIFAQKPDILKIYTELPDEFLSLKIFEDSQPLFQLTNRNEFLKEKFFDKKDGLYKASFWDFEEYYGYDEPDTTLVVDTNYWIEINRENSLASYKFDYEGNIHKLDFVIIQKKSEYFLAILEQYKPGMGVPCIIETNSFPATTSGVINNKHHIEIPQFKWNCFYPKEDVKKLNKKLLKGVEIPYLIGVKIIDNQANICLSPDIDELVWRMSENIEFADNDDMSEYDRYLETQKILGLENLPESRQKCIPLIELIEM
ncbi:MAG TPA: hypothetical protein PLL66_01585 [Bacteroidales bacterium]|nr:hypothetical protein [Bacteroidales bacterium]